MFEALTTDKLEGGLGIRAESLNDSGPGPGCRDAVLFSRFRLRGSLDDSSLAALSALSDAGWGNLFYQ